MKRRFSKSARQALQRSNKRKLLRQKIDQLADDPDSLKSNVKQLKGRKEYRLRVQDWRVIFFFEEDTVVIRDIAPRSSAYED